MRLYKYRIPNTQDIFTCSGSRVEILYTPKFNGSQIVLVESGTVDVQDRINSYAPYTDIRYMLTQLRYGNRSVLTTRPAMYGDFSSMPAHPVDALNFISDVERRFNSLSDDIKASCNNDWRVYFANMFSRSDDSSSGPVADKQASNTSDSASGGNK